MDLFIVINHFLKDFWWLIPIVIVITILKSPWGKGYLGELTVRVLSRFMLDKGTYHRVDNVTLTTPDGTTQIDHLFVSRFGIFVLETKNMQGWIFGGEDQAHWTQKIYKKSVTFQNPLRQNFKHVKALEAALNIPIDSLRSVVTFVGGSTFKTDMPPNVTHGTGFITYIKSFREQVFTENQVGDLLHRIESVRLAPTFATHRKHVENLKKRSNPNADRPCPKCGSPLVQRMVKSGERAGQQFWGCSTYPKCRVMQN
ncbi:MAG: NERD domain-containing protein [Nitrospirae bacterium]|nr:NERD domain-containing protein [Nitrospirota bacterium]